ncbi:hypothetical protein FKW77_008875 [Venturia effusa]|uniref:adenosine deaminase n=1 Tax=Venturia effusa TaxID=50376 RepID=A0A517L609_9PEZI|nr:hypothetical protein FKW77_008875 [Venturia effusa]
MEQKLENLDIEDDYEDDWNSDDEWHEAEGVPRLEDPFIQQYLAGRDALVAQEKKQRSDRVFRENLSPIASEACAIVDQIRFEEQQTIWTSEFEQSLSEGDHAGDIYPGMMFSLAKERMEKTKLWKIVRKMPKGAVLHCHFEAMVETSWILEQAFELSNVQIKASKSLDTYENRRSANIAFDTPATESKDAASIWSPDYRPDTFVPLSKAAESFPDGGKEGFIKLIVSRCTITHEESISHHEGLNDVWRKFRSTFALRHSIIYVKPVFQRYVRKLCEQLHEDNVLWADIRAQIGSRTDPDGMEDNKDFHEYVRLFDQEVEAYKASPEGKGFWGIRIIWEALRRIDKREMIEAMKRCIAVKKEFPHLIAGFDLVGQEDHGRPLADIIPELFWFKKQCAIEKIDIPFFFHAGETLGDGDSTDENLFDAVLLSTRRIGHGFSLFKHPLLIDMIKEKKILIESCPVSNEVLRLTSSIMSNPLPALLSRGVPVSLCNDDPALLGHETAGLSHDFWQALQGWENLGLAGLGSLAENSVRWAAFEDQTQKEWILQIKLGAAGNTIKAERLTEWLLQWERFCQWVVDEFGADENFEGE